MFNFLVKFTSQCFIFTYRGKISSILEGKSVSVCFPSAFEGKMYKQGIQLQTITYQGSSALGPDTKKGPKVKAHCQKTWGSVQKPMYNFSTEQIVSTCSVSAVLMAIRDLVSFLRHVRVDRPSALREFQLMTPRSLPCVLPT